MTKQRTSLAANGGLLALGLFVVGLLVPNAAAAQCLACGQDPQEGTVECIDVPWGADSCSSGTYQGISWCETSGICEWIAFLEFSEDGTALTRGEREQAPFLGKGSALDQDTALR
jgi:hypothetical protein